MGSFVGHIDESIFFLILGIWWMVNKFPRHIRSQWNKTEYTTQVSYPLPTKKFIPLEAILKVLFPIGGLTGEILTGGLALTEADGSFRKLSSMQHMSIYGIFIAHGLIDVLMSYGVPLPKGFDFLSAIAAFFWYGMSFGFHAHMHGKEELEMTIHILPISTMYACAVSGIVELMDPHCFAASVARIWCVLLIGTWFFQASFVMYVPFPLPGDRLNPRWVQTDDRNVNFIVASYGYHLILNLVVITVTYLLCYLYLKVKGEGRNQFKLLVNQVADDESYQFQPLSSKSQTNSL